MSIDSDDESTESEETLLQTGTSSVIGLYSIGVSMILSGLVLIKKRFRK